MGKFPHLFFLFIDYLTFIAIAIKIKFQCSNLYPFYLKTIYLKNVWKQLISFSYNDLLFEKFQLVHRK